MAENEPVYTVELTETESDIWKIQSVFKLPPHITSLNPNDFKPNVISFGPYHYNEPHLKHMEDLKLRSLCDFLDITDTTLQHIVQSFKPMKRKLMDHYDQLDKKWEDGDCFLELMIRDGYFMLEILLSIAGNDSNFSATDPLFRKSVHSDIMRQNIKRDMLLIENQLPLLVLDKLIADNMVVLEKLMYGYDEILEKAKECKITKEEFRNIIHKQIHALILSCFLESNEMHIESQDVLLLHVLDAFRENMIQGLPVYRGVSTTTTARPRIETATALHYTGVDFKTNVRSGLNFKCITFQDGVLTLPCIFVNKETEATFLNLMAFEKFQACKGQEVSAYIDFMNSLVHSAKDVSLLRSMNIIMPAIDSDEAIATLFHGLAKSQIANPDDSLDQVRRDLLLNYEVNYGSCKTMLARCGSIYKQMGSDFGKTYCKTPWPFIGLVVGFIILVLTFMQTYFAALSVTNQKQPSYIPPPTPPNSTRH